MSDQVKRILHIDDDEDDYIILRDMLAEIESTSYSIDWAKNEEEGLRKLKDHEYDLCLLDYLLGPTNGIDVLKTMMAQNIDVPIILLTGQGDDIVDKQAMEAGAVDYLTKGRFTTQALERIIRYAIANHQAELMRREADSLQHTKELAAAVANEFAQPLQALSNYFELMKIGITKDAYIEKIGSQIDRIKRLTNSLRNITGLKKKEYVDTRILDITRSDDHTDLSLDDKILVVDDEKPILESMVEMFEIRGLNVEGASSGKQALQLIKENDYKIIISDVMMPGMNGPELFEKVRSSGNRSLFLFITGYEIAKNLEKIISKADGVLNKPVTLEQFFLKFKELI